MCQTPGETTMRPFGRRTARRGDMYGCLKVKPTSGETVNKTRRFLYYWGRICPVRPNKKELLPSGEPRLKRRDDAGGPRSQKRQKTPGFTFYRLETVTLVIYSATMLKLCLQRALRPAGHKLPSGLRQAAAAAAVAVTAPRLPGTGRHTPSCSLGTHGRNEPREPLNSPKRAKEFIYRLQPKERTCLLKELQSFESIAIAQGKKRRSKVTVYTWTGEFDDR